jgi:hypothetical protein
MGFAPFHGGLLRWAEKETHSEIIKRLEKIVAADDISKRAGGIEKFTPSAWFVG